MHFDLSVPKEDHWNYAILHQEYLVREDDKRDNKSFECFTVSDIKSM